MGAPLTLEDVYRKIELRIDLAGSLRAAAGELGLSPAMLSLILSGKRDPGRKLLAQLGVEKRVRKIISYMELPRA